MLDRAVAGRDLMEALAAAVGAGVDWVQVRERSLEGAALLAFTEAVRDVARDAARRTGRPLRLLVNRRVDVALTAGADGVQLGFDGMAACDARRLLGPDALVGVSCHAPEQTRHHPGASHAQLAPIFSPLSKAGTRAPLGLAALESAAGGLPVLAQGGIEPDNAAACVEAGAAGVAVTGAILGSAEPGAAAAALRQALDCATG